MKRIVMQFFPSLNNYGTGMMGLVTIRRLYDLLQEKLIVESDFLPETDLAEVQAELGLGPDQVELRRMPKNSKGSGLRALAGHVAGGEVRGRDLGIVLGGDDLSEYYTPSIWKRILKLRLWALHAPVVLLGQTAGPFDRPANRRAVRWLFPGLHMFPRDSWCTDYLRQEFGLGDSLVQSTDLAFSDLPLQHDKNIETEELRRRGLTPGGYFTMVVSGLQKKGYYVKDRAVYLDNLKTIAERTLRLPEFEGKKLCLLAHTFPWYDDEPVFIDALLPLIDPELRDRVVAVTDRVLQARARFILGNGVFTLTGRMHAAVSTFQMGRPAISLSYSKKYGGVIGKMLGREDLIIEANDPPLWESGEIVTLVMEKIAYILRQEQRLATEIRQAVDEQKAILDDTFARVGAIVRHGRQDMR